MKCSLSKYGGRAVFIFFFQRNLVYLFLMQFSPAAAVPWLLQSWLSVLLPVAVVGESASPLWSPGDTGCRLNPPEMSGEILPAPQEV